MYKKMSKIVGTMGPSISNEEFISKAIDNGLNILRVNFSHAKYDEVKNWIKMLDNINKKNNSYVAWMADTKGPEIRIDLLENDSVFLEKNSILRIRNDHLIGNEKSFSISYENLYQSVKKNTKILLDDALIELKVIDIENEDIIVEVINSGELKSKKGVNVPNVALDMPFISEKDYQDIKFACENNASYIAASFTRRVEDINQIRKLCKNFNREDVQIIAKIENHEGVENSLEIIKASDGIMVARGDLGSELPMEEVPIIQLELAKLCNINGKPIIIATHMLDSMERNPRPTRAEVGDVALAISQGADAIMLSGETAKGEYPIEAISTMAKIASRIETTIDHNKILKRFIDNIDISQYDGIGLSVVELASKINAKAIFCFTESGQTAKKISKYRPTCPIYALSQNDKTLYSLALNWGVLYCEKVAFSDLESKYKIANEKALQIGIKKYDLVIVTGGHPNTGSLTNFLKVLEVGNEV